MFSGADTSVVLYGRRQPDLEHMMVADEEVLVARPEAPGSTVTVVSEYGSGSTTINPDGGFEIKVFFETAPKNVEFPVKVKDSHTGEVKVFSFKALG